MFCLHVCVCTMCVPGVPEKRVGFPRAGVTGSCELPGVLGILCNSELSQLSCPNSFVYYIICSVEILTREL